MIEGIAEIFGTELSNDVEYKFNGCKNALYSFGGCKIEYSGKVSSEYVSEETQMSAYLNIHFAFEKIRMETSTRGPRVLVLGSKDSGKTSLIKILSSYANRMDRTPMVVNLNPSEGCFTIPGTISAAQVSDILDVEDGWGQSYSTGPTLLHPKQPNVRYLGFDDIDKNMKFYKYNISRLGITACSRLEEDEKMNKSGIFIDTPALNIKNIQLIEDIISDFEVDHVLVIGNERLFIDLNKKLNLNKISLIKVPKSGGCVERDDSYIRRLQQKLIREYFYGNYKTILSPYTVNIDFSVVKVYKPIIEEVDTISSVLPIGEDEDEDQKGLKHVKLIEPVEPSASVLQNSLIAILQADKQDDENIVLRSSVLGFGVITGVDDEKSKLRILIPVPGRLPEKAMILGQFSYIE